MVESSSNELFKAAYVGYCALPFINNKNSDGNHIWDTSLAKEEDWLKVSYQQF